jgi:Chitobiase/beta-hexosaminidase C-terminal domain
MKVLLFSCLGSQTLVGRVRAFAALVARCGAAFLDSTGWTSQPRPFANVNLPSPASLKSPSVRIRQLSGSRCYRVALGVTVAVLTLTMMSGCGGSSATPNSVQPTPATPSISPATGTYVGSQQVTITDATPGATVYDTTDGTVPSTSSAAYTGPISIAASSTVQAIAVLQGVSSAVASSVLTITPAHPPAKLAFLQQPENALTGATISPAVQVEVEDADGNLVTNATNVVTLALTAGAGLGGTLTATAQNGIASFSNLTVSTSGSYTLLATSTGLTSATSAAFTVTTPVKLAFVVQPANAATGVVISPSVQVAIQDADGNTVAIAANPVTLALTSGAGLQGTLTATPQNGVATFSNLAVSTPGSYTLSATSPGLTAATSASFTVTTPVKLAFLVQPSNALTGAAISPAVQVAIQDAGGNTVTAAANPVAIALVGSAELGGTLSVTPQKGVATFSNLTVSSAGSYTLSATSSGLTAATSTSFIVTSPPATYYLSPNGNDSNSGLSASSPWLSPNHPVNCGDVIVAASGTYFASNFVSGNWGTVTCLLGNNVAWLQCASFDSCRISAGSDGMWIDESYWGVQGWEITTNTSVNAACFHAGPNLSAPVNVHHIIFADNVANGCMGGGFTAYNNSTTASVDYIAYVGNIAYSSTRGSGNCYSGLNIYQPIASDNNAGTHLYVGGNFSYSNLDPDPCNGTAPTDGEGIILDTLDFSQSGGPNYTQQVLVKNNILVNNGGRGIEVFNNSAGPSHAPIIITQNTSWGNLTDPNQNSTGCGEVALETASETQVYGNLVSTRSATGCGVNPIYALSVQTGDFTDVVNSNFAFGYNGNNTYLANSGTFAYGPNNILGMNPNFSNATVPAAPNCQNTSNVPSCMAALVNDFASTAAAATGFGYQAPSSASSPDPLFPQWLCNVNLPPGLVTLGCAKP